MKSDMDGYIVAKMLVDDQRAADAYTFKGTPIFLIGTEAVRGALSHDEMKKIIDRQISQ